MDLKNQDQRFNVMCYSVRDCLILGYFNITTNTSNPKCYRLINYQFFGQENVQKNEFECIIIGNEHVLHYMAMRGIFCFKNKNKNKQSIKWKENETINILTLKCEWPWIQQLNSKSMLKKMFAGRTFILDNNRFTSLTPLDIETMINFGCLDGLTNDNILFYKRTTSKLLKSLSLHMMLINGNNTLTKRRKKKKKKKKTKKKQEILSLFASYCGGIKMLFCHKLCKSRAFEFFCFQLRYSLTVNIGY